MTTAPLLSVKDLYISYNSARQRLFGPSPKSHQAIKGVSFAVAEGETLALVGESGSGKSSIGNAVLGLAPVQSGQVTFEGTDITNATQRQRRALASRLQVIFQNPYGSLNPSLQIGQILTEPLRVLGQHSATESRKTISNLLERVGLPSDAQTRFPGNFSGGQRQRIAIARALAVNPRLVVCDEPTSALDASTQQSVLELLRELQESIGAAYLFITHDLAVVRQFADRVAVLDHGRIVEVGEAKEVCDSPHHPYTKALIEAAPVPNPAIQRLRRQRRLATRNAATLSYDV